MPYLCTTIVRPDESGDSVEHDIKVWFSADCTVAASRACWDDPGYPAEYDVTFESAEFHGRFAPEGHLTETELATLRTWFLAKENEAWEAANDNAAAGR
jgi:hypothetical protein